ncbi:hypothetical protein Q0F99_12805 [Rathayibacter oskolensis]|nr:hypothetical protein [Rathayibacter oskolensis]WKK70683.1 hypothetical protein Q0F99_12805 [Rathayibacter oskolensis]
MHRVAVGRDDQRARDHPGELARVAVGGVAGDLGEADGAFLGARGAELGDQRLRRRGRDLGGALEQARGAERPLAALGPVIVQELRDDREHRQVLGQRLGGEGGADEDGPVDRQHLPAG